jgi:predicted DsbA family dithiol-disulfide isomerase
MTDARERCPACKGGGVAVSHAEGLGTGFAVCPACYGTGRALSPAQRAYHRLEAAARELLKADIAAAHAAGRREALTEVAEWCEAAADEAHDHAKRWETQGRRDMVTTWLNMSAGRRYCARHARELAEQEGTEHV